MLTVCMRYSIMRYHSKHLEVEGVLLSLCQAMTYRLKGTTLTGANGIDIEIGPHALHNAIRLAYLLYGLQTSSGSATCSGGHPLCCLRSLASQGRGLASCSLALLHHTVALLCSKLASNGLLALAHLCYRFRGGASCPGFTLAVLCSCNIDTEFPSSAAAMDGLTSICGA